METFWKVNGVSMPTPSSLKQDFEDLDDESYRSCITGNLIRERIAKGVAKLELNFNYITDTQVKLLKDYVNNSEEISVEFFTPVVSNSWASCKCYSSKFNVEIKNTGVGFRYNVSFNIVQSQMGDFN